MCILSTEGLFEAQAIQAFFNEQISLMKQDLNGASLLDKESSFDKIRIRGYTIVILLFQKCMYPGTLSGQKDSLLLVANPPELPKSYTFCSSGLATFGPLVTADVR